MISERTSPDSTTPMFEPAYMSAKPISNLLLLPAEYIAAIKDTIQKAVMNIRDSLSKLIMSIDSFEDILYTISLLSLS